MGIKTVGTIVKANGKEVGALQSLGNISQKRNVQEYDAINVESVLIAVGSVKTDALQLGVIYDPADSAGAKELETAFNNATAIPFSIELSDKGSNNGTTFSWDEAVVSDFSLEPQKDGFVLATFSVYLNGKPTVTAAS
jgi:predicted homoserine dehydrogenase-like protein